MATKFTDQAQLVKDYKRRPDHRLVRHPRLRQ